MLALPFVVWWFTARREGGFFGWLGWRRPQTAHPKILALLLVTTVILMLAPGLFLMASGNATAPFSGRGWTALPAVVVYAWVQTSFTEESFFRGFLLKRIAAWRGFWWGNISQAVLFGLLHAVPVAMLVDPTLGLIAGLFTGATGVALGYLNERVAGGSIVPGWIVHGVSNTVAGCLALWA